MQNESSSMAMAYLANLAKFDPQEDSFSRFSQKSHSHPSEMNSDRAASRLILEPSQSGNDLEPANQAFPILVECWTPSGIRRVVEADSVEHADWIRQMNPKPQQVRCVDCHHATLNGGVAKCGVGVDSGLATGGFWYTDVHFCIEFAEVSHDG